jgi:hypothetical protein
MWPEAARQELLGGLGIERRMEELIERAGVDAEDRLLLRDAPVLHHLDGDAHRCPAGALPGAALEHVELAGLDGELQILHVAEVRLEPGADPGQLLERVRHLRLERVVGAADHPRFLHDRHGRADAGDDVLALRVGEPLAVEALLAGRRIAREGDAGGAGVAQVAEHHRLHVARGAPAVGDVVHAAVHVGAVVVPGGEDRLDRAPQLLPGVARKVLPRLLLHDRLERRHQLPKLTLGEVGVGDLALQLLAVHARRVDAERLGHAEARLVERVLEVRLLHAERDVRVHRHEAPVRVVGEARVLRLLGQPLRGRVVQAQVEDGVHHPRHRRARAGADAHEERVLGVAELHPHALLDPRERRRDRGLEPFGPLSALQELDAGLGGEREAGRHGEPQRRHLCQARPLAAEQVLAFRVAVRFAVTEVIDVSFHRGCLLRGRTLEGKVPPGRGLEARVRA